MTAKLFSDAMNEIGAKYVEEALYYERPKKRSFFAETAKRAAAVLLACAGEDDRAPHVAALALPPDLFPAAGRDHRPRLQ